MSEVKATSWVDPLFRERYCSNLRMNTPRSFRLAAILALLGGGVAACDDPLALTPATATSVVDTLRLYALRDTDVVLPSGYDLPSKTAIRTDRAQFDIAFDIDAQGTPLLYPAGALGLSRGAGILTMAVPFDSIVRAPDKGYGDSAAVAIPVGAVFVVRSRPNGSGCTFVGALPRYGKFQVLSLDPVARSVTFQTLVNQNCGYRSLRPGIPTA